MEDGGQKSDLGHLSPDIGRLFSEFRGWIMASIRSIKDLKVYNLAYALAMEVFERTKTFPKEETYSLTDQIRRSSRSVAINIREGYAKRKYKQVFIRHLNDAAGSCEETRGWLDFARECKYITESDHKKLEGRYDEVCAMLYRLAHNWRDLSDI